MIPSWYKSLTNGSEGRPVLPIELNHRAYSILVVDDNVTNLKVITEYLQVEGFDVMAARDGFAALKRAELGQPHLILLDVMMPELDGFETCRRLKTNPKTHDIPVIFMTALTSEDDKVKGFEAGAVDYVTKPLQEREVLARVTTHLRLQEQARQLIALNASKDKFFSIVAHDLRSPFTPLLGTTKLLARRAAKENLPKLAEMATSISESAQQVYDLLENLLHWSRVQLGRISYQPDSIPLKPVINRTIALMTDAAATKSIHLISDVSDDIVVFADENMLDTVLRNLLSNAIKFTPTDGDVSIIAHAISADMAEVAVIDTGVGMSAEQVNNLFSLEKTHTTRGTAQEKGTGLGLIICKEMAEHNGGRLIVESQQGHGTTVKVTVPLVEAVPIAAPAMLSHNDLQTLATLPETTLAPLLEVAKMGDMRSLRKQLITLKQTESTVAQAIDYLVYLVDGFEDAEIQKILRQSLS